MTVTRPPTADLDLLRAWREGDAGAGNHLVRRHFHSVHRFFRTKVDGEIDDLIQRTFLGCVEAVDRFREDAQFKTFLLSIARNQLFLHYREGAMRKRREIVDLSVHELGGGRSPSGIVVKRDEQRVLLEALRRLPLEQQITLELYYWENLSIAEAATVLELAEGTVKSRLGRARDALRRIIGELEVSPELRARTLSDLEQWAAGLRELE